MDTWRWNWHITIVSVLGIVFHSNGTSCDLSLFHIPIAVIESPQTNITFRAKSAPETNLCLSLYCVCVYLVFAAAFIDQSWYSALFCLVCYRIQTSSPLKISFHGWHLFFPFVSFSIKGHQLLLHKETKTFDQIQGKILIYSSFSLIFQKSNLKFSICSLSWVSTVWWTLDRRNRKKCKNLQFLSDRESEHHFSPSLSLTENQITCLCNDGQVLIFPLTAELSLQLSLSPVIEIELSVTMCKLCQMSMFVLTDFHFNQTYLAQCFKERVVKSLYREPQALQTKCKTCFGPWKKVCLIL